MEDFSAIEAVQTGVTNALNVAMVNTNVWTPVFFAWACGAVYNKYLQDKQSNRRSSEREWRVRDAWRVYVVDAFIATGLYITFNMYAAWGDIPSVIKVFSDSLSAGYIAVLFPIIYFSWKNKR